MTTETNLMKTVAMTGFGGVETFILENRAMPVPKEGEVRIRIKAAGFNPVDCKIRANWYGGDPQQVLGCDCSGIIDAIGPGESRFLVGDEVYAMTFRSSNGSYAAFTCVPEELVEKKPRNLSFEEAATVPLAAMTAYRATLSVGAAKKGDNVFVAGIGGGVGSFVLELLRLAEVGEIFTIAKDEKSAQFLIEKMGIAKDHILIYEGLSADQLKQNLLSMNKGEFFDATFDLVGKEMKRLCIELTGYSGHFSTILPENKFEIPFWGENDIPRGRNLSVHQVAIGAELGKTKRMQIYSRHLQALTTLLVEKRIKPPVVTVVGSLSEKTVQKAHNMLESGRIKGKLVMIVE